MIETDYIITCDRCERNGEPVTLHSLKQFGRIVIGSLWKRLNKAGWHRINGKDCCPDCVRELTKKPARKGKR